MRVNIAPKRLRFFRGKTWIVKSDERGMYFAFDNRQDARTFKKLLAKSNRRVDAEIICQEHYGKFVVEEKKS